MSLLPPGLQGAAAPTYIQAVYLNVFYKGLANNTSDISAYKGVIFQGFILYYTRQNRLKLVLHNPPFQWTKGGVTKT